MKRLLWTCAVLALGGGQALAGPCTSQITALEQHLSSRDAGAGPVIGSGTGSNAEKEASKAGTATRSTTEASRTAAEVRANGSGGGTQKVGPTGTMGQATAGAAASPQDVRLQQQGKPTQAQAGLSQTPAAARGEDKMQQVTANLDRARKLDGSNDAACMSAISDARKALNTD